jgi:hypothetical protein
MIKLKQQHFQSKRRLTREIISFVAMSFLFSACVSDSGSGSGSSGDTANAVASNSSSGLGIGEGRVLQDNPIILSGNANLDENITLGSLLQSNGDFITTNTTLFDACENIDNCFSVRQDNTTTPLASVNNKWAFAPNTSEFLQVHTFFHVNKSVDFFQGNIDFTINQANPGLAPTTSFPFQYPTSIPQNLKANNAHWDKTKSLDTQALCDIADNAFFSPANFSMCLGFDSLFNNVKFAQDPTVVYHELGHAYNQIRLNMRNSVAGLTQKSDLGVIFYDEAGSIGEGIADYESFAINKRSHFGEWALGRFLQASRPMEESDPIHAAGISTSNGQRLRYPEFLNYDPNNAANPLEDVHFAGQIISHYMVALTRSFQSQCSMNVDQATQAVLSVLNESLAFMGDLTAKGNDFAPFGEFPVNLTPNHARLWIDNVNPINYRRFAQTMAKYIKLIYSDPNRPRCNGGVFPKDAIEQLLDQYGLLLFKTYNEDGNGISTGHTFGGSSAVNVLNKEKSVLIGKNQLIFDPNGGASEAFVFDNRAALVNILESFQANGTIQEISDQIEADLPFNNGNGQISPGEFVGIALNLFNNSNSPMAGVQVLANDWDHLKGNAPCNNFEDNFPSLSEGAADSSSESGLPGDCTYITRDNGDEVGESIDPICFVQDISGGSSTQYISQSLFRSKIGVEPKNCLGGSSSTKDCFIRAVKGADFSYNSKIEGKKTWAETLFNGGSPTFSTHNVMFFETSKDIPPGTTFNCRFRARFTNCDDCFTDAAQNNDDFLDFEYSGGKPFRVINFQFTVID